MPSPLMKKSSPTSSPTSSSSSSPWLNKQLRSPRGSPRGSSRNGNGDYMGIRFLLLFNARHFRCLVLCSFPLLLIIQWRSSLTLTNATSQGSLAPLPNLPPSYSNVNTAKSASRRNEPSLDHKSPIPRPPPSRLSRQVKGLGEDGESHSTLTNTTVSKLAEKKELQQPSAGVQTQFNNNSTQGTNLTEEHHHSILHRVYNSEHYRPLVPPDLFSPQSSGRLPVILLGSSSTRNIETSPLLDGLTRSRHIQVIANQEDWRNLQQQEQQHMIVVHLVDWMALDRDCHVLHEMYGNVVQPPGHLLVYFDASASTRVVTCPAVNALFQSPEPSDSTSNYYRVLKQSIVQGRHWDPRLGWVSLGKIVHTDNVGDGPILHAPYFLREKFVEMMAQVYNATKSAASLAKHNHENDDDQESLDANETDKEYDASFFDRRHRKLDVVHIWRKGDASHYGNLRRKVSDVIRDLNGTQVNGHSLKWLVRPRGEDDAIERAVIQPEYVVTLRSAKIIVVAQRDEWEDHWRLMESLASGALVLTDVMLAMPHGLRNGTNIITYHDDESLRRLILHFAHSDNEKERIRIARNGWKLVMSQHRSWHRMEHLLFGAVLTQAQIEYSNHTFRQTPEASLRL